MKGTLWLILIPFIILAACTDEPKQTEYRGGTFGNVGAGTKELESFDKHEWVSCIVTELSAASVRKCLEIEGTHDCTAIILIEGGRITLTENDRIERDETDKCFMLTME